MQKDPNERYIAASVVLLRNWRNSSARVCIMRM